MPWSWTSSYSRKPPPSLELDEQLQPKASAIPEEEKKDPDLAAALQHDLPARFPEKAQQDQAEEERLVQETLHKATGQMPLKALDDDNLADAERLSEVYRAKARYPDDPVEANEDERGQ